MSESTSNRIYTSAHGIQIAYVHHDSPVTHCGLMIGAGTRDEPAGKEGLAHFLEHMLFKGTKKRRAFQVINRLEVVGGELNAFTTKEETCVHASFLNPYFERAVELIGDIVLQSEFPEKEMKREKNVVIDEIRSYADNPMEQIFDDFECQVFRGQPLGTPILGSETSVLSFSRTDLFGFVKRHYAPSRMVFSYAGPLPSGDVITAINRYFNSRSKPLAPKSVTRKPRSAARHIIENRTTTQAHCILGATAYSSHVKKRFPLFLMNNILGGPGMNSRLNMNIRERYGLTYHIESSYVPFRDTGLFQVYMSTDREQLLRARELVMKELKKLREEAIGKAQLTRYKYQLKGQLALVQEHMNGVMLGNAKSVLNYGRMIRIGELFRHIDDITSSGVMDVANEILGEQRISSLVYEPQGA